MVHLCGRGPTTFVNNHLLGRQEKIDGLLRKVAALNANGSGCNTIAVKLAVKQVNCSFNGGHHDKAAIFSSTMASLNTDSEIWDSSVLDKKVKTLKKNGIHAKLHRGYASNSEDGDFWWSFIIGLVYQLKLLYQFSRPHTVIGTIIGITSVSLLPLQNVGDICPSFFVGLVKALVPSVLMNVYVVGLNQLFDVDIDKINKPNLPLASGDLSMATGISIVAASLFMSLAMGVKFQSPPLLYALLASFVLGSVYSIELPLLRWKKQAFLAASCIMIIRAIMVQAAFFLHIQRFVLGKPVVITRSLVFAIAFMCFFSAVIALFKDIPDVDGDQDYGIQSFSVKLGPERVFWLCVNMLFVAYGTAMVVGATSSVLVSKLVTVLGHSILALILWLRAQKVDISSKVSITSFYMLIWQLFYAEYFLIPFVR